MNSVPETNVALSELSLLGDTDLVADLRGLTDQARTLVPELVGVSVQGAIQTARRDPDGVAPGPGDQDHRLRRGWR